MKLYVGNLGDEGSVKSEDLRPLFEQFGSVTECECIKNYAFVHMEDGDKATEAVTALNGTTIKGRPIKVEKSESRGPRKPSQKLFVGNLAEGTVNQELKELFERYAPVIEADIIKNFGFVHIDADAGKGKINEILRELNGFSLNGSQIRVQQSTSGVRQKPGMGGDQCYRCGRDGHWSKECPLYPDPPGSYVSSGGARGGSSPGGRGGPMRGAAPYGSRNMGGGYRGGDPYPPPPPPSYMRERGGYDSGNGYANSGEYGARQMGGSSRAMATDPYGRPAQQVYDDRRGGYSAVPMGGSRDMMRAADPYGRYDSGQDMAYSQHPMANPGGYGDASTYGSAYGGQMQAGSSVPAYSTQPAYATGNGAAGGGGGGGSDAYNRRSDGSASQRSDSGYGVAPRGMPGGGQGYGQPQQQPPSGYGSGRGYGVY